MKDIKNRGLVFNGKPTPVPYFTFAVTGVCNYKCSYCCIGAENHGFEGEEISLDEMLEIAGLFYERGVKVFRITGGEPTIWKPLEDLIKGIHAIAPDTQVNLNSNASLPRKLLPIIERNAERFTLRVSVDRMTPAPDTPKVWTSRLQETLQEARKFVPVRLNMVVMRSNMHELPQLMDLCNENDFDLKLLDLYYNRDFFGEDGKTMVDINQFWWQQFVPILDTLSSVMEEKGFEFMNQYDHGNFGIPLPIFTNGKIYISVKDSTRGTHFHDACKGCSEYRCQEGLYSPMLSSTGTLHVGECRFKPYMTEMRGLSMEDKAKGVDKMLTLFKETKLSQSKLSEILEAYRAEAAVQQGLAPETHSPFNRSYKAEHL
ncbi:MAG: radical SAM protein [Alphaproteobacteria bacterium]|nr:radical SAM protein [Alphaproteobacteria bacterium]